MKFLIQSMFALTIFCSVNANALTCKGKVTGINHWIDAQANQVNFKLKTDSGYINIKTTTQKHVPMVMTALAADLQILAYWSCGAPASCDVSGTLHEYVATSRQLKIASDKGKLSKSN